jgi:hypothetical protein
MGAVDVDWRMWSELKVPCKTRSDQSLFVCSLRVAAFSKIVTVPGKKNLYKVVVQCRYLICYYL